MSVRVEAACLFWRLGAHVLAWKSYWITGEEHGDAVSCHYSQMDKQVLVQRCFFKAQQWESCMDVKGVSPWDFIVQLRSRSGRELSVQTQTLSHWGISECFATSLFFTLQTKLFSLFYLNCSYSLVQLCFPNIWPAVSYWCSRQKYPCNKPQENCLIKRPIMLQRSAEHLGACFKL